MGTSWSPRANPRRSTGRPSHSGGTEGRDRITQCLDNNKTSLEDTAMQHAEGKMVQRRRNEGSEMNRSSRGEDAADAWPEGDKLPQTRGRRGTSCRRRVDGGGQVAADAWMEEDKMPQTPGRNVSARNQGSHCTGCVQLATQWTRLKMPPPMHGRRRARGTGAPNPLRRRSSLRFPGSTRNLRRLPQWFSVGL